MPELKENITRLLYPLSSYPPKTYSFPLMQAPQLPDMEVGSSPSMRCIVLQQELYEISKLSRKQIKIPFEFQEFFLNENCH